MTTLIEAIHQLDPANDDHWTAQGLPAMEALKGFLGDDSITRPQVTEAAPDLNRTTVKVSVTPPISVDPPAPAGGDADAGADPIKAAENKVEALQVKQLPNSGLV